MLKSALVAMVLVALSWFGQSPAVATNLSCDGRLGFFSTSCGNPASNEVIVYGDIGGNGKCMKLNSGSLDQFTTPTPLAGQIADLGAYGFADCISSVRVGQNVRLLGFKDYPFNAHSANGVVTHNLGWNMATYEWNGNVAEATTADDFSSLIVQDIPGTNGEYLPYRYVGSAPTASDHGFWSAESQGLCHNRTHWFLTQEVPLDGNAQVNPNFSCIQTSPAYSGKIWRVPRDADLASPSPPPGSTSIDLKDLPPDSSIWSGFRHVGDPDCQTIGGKDYVFVPVQGCTNSGSAPLPYVLVLDGYLNYVASWTIPSQGNANVSNLAACFQTTTNNPYLEVMGSGHGMGAWVAARPNPNSTDVEIWMSGEICNGMGMHVFHGDINQRGVVAMSAGADPLITDMVGSREFYIAAQGGAFSPSGKTLFVTSGDPHHQGGIRVINPLTGQELTESDSADGYGPFDYRHDLTQDLVLPTGQEPEGVDFLDAGCVGTPVASTGGSNLSSQLHVVMSHNGISDSGDQVEVRHYAFSGNVSQSACELSNDDPANAPADFNLDRLEDILWRNISTGATQIWYMFGVSRAGFDDFPNSLVIDPLFGLNAAGLGDFNQDGRQDILWHSGAGGQWTIWYMDGKTRLGIASLSSGLNVLDSSGWRFAAARDFDLDGHTDMLFHNGITGASQVWYMGGADGSSRRTAQDFPALINNVTDASGWTIAGVADFDLDGHPDIVWHNGQTGELQIWYMNGPLGVNRRDAGVFAPGISVFGASGWRVEQIGDFNFDRKPDVLWHNGVTGELQVWYMNGVNWTQSVSLANWLWLKDQTGWRIVKH